MLMRLWFLSLTAVMASASLEYRVSQEDGVAKPFRGSPVTEERSLQECNEILATWTADELTVFVETAIDNSLGADSFEAIAIKFTLLPALNHGVQVRRLCASCTDFPVNGQPPAYANFCTAYGSEVAHSGLLMIPLAADGSLLPGTHRGSIYCHGTSTQAVPSNQFRGEESAMDIVLNVAIASTGSVVLLPDYMGYGKSSGSVFKAYLVRQQYLTSVIPLWLMADKVLQDESSCGSALADAAVVFGYSEGGYASVAIADGLHSMNVDIIKVEAGGGPYRTGSMAVLESIRGVRDGTFPPELRFYFALFGSAYSSTYPALANFNGEQDMLSDASRNSIVGLVTRSASENDINNAVPIDDPLSIFSGDLLSFAQTALDNDVFDPCRSSQLVQGFNDLLCQALYDNDLTETLENTPYPVRLCHSANDEVVSVYNTPDFTRNDLLTYFGSSGNHVEAAVGCLLQAATFILSSEFVNAAFAAKHSETGCLAQDGEPTLAPTELQQDSIEPSATTSPSPTSTSEVMSAPPSSATRDFVPLYECGEILSSWNATEVGNLLSQVFGDAFGDDSQAQKSLQFGVQVRKICASCNEFYIPDASFLDYCGSTVYGSSSNHSGLLMLPLSSDGTAIAEGTFPGLIYNHAATINRVPSNEWNGADSPITEIMFGVLPAAAGSVAILPDYFGYGETNGALYKACLVKQSYLTSTVPLWLKAADILEKESDCSALADAAALAGFAEGGYASVVVADALHDLGVDIIGVQAGAVPAKLGSVLIPEMVRSIDDEEFPLTERFILALLGSAYSLSYPDLLNFEEGPYMLDTSVLEGIVELVTDASDANSVERAVPMGDPLSILDGDFIEGARQVYMNDLTDTCAHPWSETFCATLLDNDLTDMMEKASYPITLCHSPDDDVISIANLPNVTENGTLTVLLVEGNHIKSAATCASQIIDFLTSAKYLLYPVQAKHVVGGCFVPETPAPSTGPTSTPPALVSSANYHCSTTVVASLLGGILLAMRML